MHILLLLNIISGAVLKKYVPFTELSCQAKLVMICEGGGGWGGGGGGEGGEDMLTFF